MDVLCTWVKLTNLAAGLYSPDPLAVIRGREGLGIVGRQGMGGKGRM